MPLHHLATLAYLRSNLPKLNNFINPKTITTMAKYRCEVCNWIYDEEVGYPEGGIAAGTKFEDLPEDFECPLCGVGKEDFVQE